MVDSHTLTTEEEIQEGLRNCIHTFDPWDGSCGNIAAALNNAYDSAQLVSVSDSPDEHNSAHFVVRIDGELYDGMGKVSKTELVERFGHNSPVENIDNYFHDVRSVEQYGYLVHGSVVSDLTRCLEEVQES